MLIPIGHEEDAVRRLPWVSIVVMAICIVAFFLSTRQASQIEERAQRRLVEVAEYYAQRPYLELEDELAAGAKWWFYEDGEEDAYAAEDRRTAADYGVGPMQQESQQRELDELTVAWREARAEIPTRRWGLVPNDFQAGDLIASIFMHAGLMHLLGNLMFFWLSGPPLEDVWGRPFFSVFFLAAGVVGGLLWVARFPASNIPLVGASGAVAGLMGAFMVRFWSTQIRMYYFYFIGFRFLSGTFNSPAWVMLGLWFARELFSASAFDRFAGETGGVAYWVHVWGFAFGAGTAAVIRHFKIEEKVFRPKIDVKLGEETNTIVEQAHQLRQEGRLDEARDLLADELRQRPSNWDANLSLWDIGLQLGQPQEAQSALLRLIRHELRQNEHELAVSHWLELNEHCPEIEIDLNLRLRLAEAMVEDQRDDEASGLLAQVHEMLDPSLPMGLRVRLARAAALSRSPSTPGLCGPLLNDPAVPEEIRQEISELLARAQAQGLRTSSTDDEAGAPDDNAPLPLSEEVPAQRVLKVMSAVPKHLTGEKIGVELAGGGGTRVLPLANVQSVAAARIDEDLQNAYVVIDLLVDSLWSDRVAIRTVRLRSTAFDARTLVPQQTDPLAALIAFIDTLVAVSGATPLPDADSVRGQPFYRFASLAEYESKVFGFVAG
ncbi:MAG: rhomboid family intramembrane serine protease [Acidobacteriota bacterium]